MSTRHNSFGDFTCRHCHAYVSSLSVLSGVNNRNHCPYCLWSRHLDWFAAGDRLSACKALMRPVALTLKRSRNKYRLGGELMVVHVCVECAALSINRIAADDDAEKLMAVLQESFSLSQTIQMLMDKSGIRLLGTESMGLVQRQLFGSEHSRQIVMT